MDYPDHALKLPKRTIINQMCAIKRWGERFASFYPILVGIRVY